MEVEAWQGRKVTSVACGGVTRPWSWTTAHCTRSVVANMVDLGMEIEAAGITEARGGGGVARAQSHVGRVRLYHTAVVLDDGTLYTFGMAAMVDLGTNEEQQASPKRVEVEA